MMMGGSSVAYRGQRARPITARSHRIARPIPSHRHRNAATILLISMAMMMMTLLQQLPPAQADILVYQMLSDQIIEEFRDLPATFGGEIPDTGLKVLADRADPADGCSAMRPPPNVTSSKFAVVIARYNCSFEEKVRNAQLAGYAMVIVHNVGSNDLEHMSANHPQDLIIPSVFVGESSGRGIIESYLYDHDYALVITDDIPFNISNNLIIPFAIVVGLCFIIMVLFMIARCIRERRRTLRRRLPPSLLRRMGIVKFVKGMHYETCAICLEDFVENDRLRVLPCRHAYHALCIDPWLTKSRRVCPICKRRVLVQGERRQRRHRSSSGSMSSSDADENAPLLQQNAAANNAGAAAQPVSDVLVTNANAQSPNAQPTTTQPTASSVTVDTASSDGNVHTSRSYEALLQAINTVQIRVQHSDDDDELLDDRNVQQPMQRTGDTTSSGASPYGAIGDEEQLTRWQRFKSFFSRPRTQYETLPDATAGGVGISGAGSNNSSNNILNTQHSGSFHTGEETTDDELIERMNDVVKRSQVRSAPDLLPSTSGRRGGGGSGVVGEAGAGPSSASSPRLGVVALPNVNFEPPNGGGTSGGIWPSSSSSSSSSRRQSRPRTRGGDIV
ncbi:E3 ubiquitin-protein ligase RNF13 isoform X2 [Anopheles darlingi]|uniref:E3 ubiquitin-protein ligase RNF13 isoform X2 n=1 Tax=Anopheles darlingi TaxID=43151 RepID=UPI0021003264|nr:E3 ubiquitin-protein ligase RNF13 isoform X2 [Anopheles darlingi]